ncbi:MAG: mycofactocin system transcriptional regulator [Nocardioidaceae bacterium]|nr:MAG: mycofactocin system transcriptional regulator [Nocardioidaceae bacterium]
MQTGVRVSVSTRRSSVGRPEATSHAAIEEAAFALFAERGFEATTIDDIARAVGVSRRTLFRYYPSKNDIPWGQFDRTLDHFRGLLAELPVELPLREAVHRGVIAFNDFPDDAQPSHRDRMRLILQTPALEAHSVLRYGQWRQVIAEFVADRLGMGPEEPLPVVVGQVALAKALAAYSSWLREPGTTIAEHLQSIATALDEFDRL